VVAEPRRGGTEELNVVRRLAGNPLALALAAAAACLAWQYFLVHSQYGGNWTGLFRVGAHYRLPPELDAITLRQLAGGDYDGQFYRLVARDLWPPFENAAFVDAPFTRYSRVLVPLTGRLLAFGRAEWVDQGLIAAVLLTVFLGVWWSARFFEEAGRPAWYGLLFLVVPAVPASVERILTDSALAALAVALMLYAGSNPRAGWWIAAAAALTRDFGFSFAAALGLTTRRWIYFTALLPAACWWGLLAANLQPGLAGGNFDLLPLALMRRFFVVRSPWWLETLDAIAMTGMIVCLALAIRWAWPRRSKPSGATVLIWSAFAMISGGPLIMTEPFSWARLWSPLFCWVLYEAVLRGSRAGLAAVAAVSLTPLAYSAKALLSGVGWWR